MGRVGGHMPVGNFCQLRLAARELRSGLSGFYVFIACVALGVMYPIIDKSLLEAARQALLDKMAYMSFIIGG